MKSWIKIFFFIVLIGWSFPLDAGAKTIKFATLAPEGSTWMKIMRELDKDVQKATKGNVKFKIFPGGVSGDEQDVLRKIRLGQIHSAAFTGVGMGEILPSMRILDLPFLTKNYDEVDHLRSELYPTFYESFEKKGFILLAWAEVGFVYFYSRDKITSIRDMKKMKMWIWEGDPLASAFFQAIDINPLPLTIPNVLTSLQTGLVESVYTSPLGVIALQWFTKTKYMLDLPMTNATAGILISKKSFEKLSQEEQAILRQKTKEHMQRLITQTRKDNESSITVLKENGIQVVNPAKGEREEFNRAGEKVREMLVGKLYDRELLENVLRSLAEFRKKQK